MDDDRSWPGWRAAIYLADTVTPDDPFGPQHAFLFLASEGAAGRITVRGYLGGDSTRSIIPSDKWDDIGIDPLGGADNGIDSEVSAVPKRYGEDLGRETWRSLRFKADEIKARVSGFRKWMGLPKAERKPQPKTVAFENLFRLIRDNIAPKPLTLTTAHEWLEKGASNCPDGELQDLTEELDEELYDAGILKVKYKAEDEKLFITLLDTPSVEHELAKRSFERRIKAAKQPDGAA